LVSPTLSAIDKHTLSGAKGKERCGGSHEIFLRKQFCSKQLSGTGKTRQCFQLCNLVNPIDFDLHTN